MYKFTLTLIALTLSHASYAADIVVEEKSLSQPKIQALPNSKPVSSQTIATDSTPSISSSSLLIFCICF